MPYFSLAFVTLIPHLRRKTFRVAHSGASTELCHLHLYSLVQGLIVIRRESLPLSETWSNSTGIGKAVDEVVCGKTKEYRKKSMQLTVLAINYLPRAAASSARSFLSSRVAGWEFCGWHGDWDSGRAACRRADGKIEQEAESSSGYSRAYMSRPRQRWAESGQRWADDSSSSSKAHLPESHFYAAICPFMPAVGQADLSSFGHTSA
ncbi:hypothetical protein B0H13DRAFT_1895067 [Mycena leptocephala]|nr:hypothetical protein B0H13DRAFT_1895067 [Mycena leptocephala]